MFRTPIWTLLLLAFLSVSVVTAQDYETEETDEPGARVARISFLDGDAKIKRIDIEEWEDVVENLPLVEGDTIETDKDTKLEIQLDRYSFLRLDENSLLKFTFLADDGIALSLSKGTLGVTLIKFEPNDTYLEIDAPKSTVSIQKSGTYRIDAGNEYNREVRVSVGGEGKARVYSADSGFSLNDGRSARLFLDGNLEGEWETSQVSSIIDEFDDWSTDRNRGIAAKYVDDDNVADNDYYDDDVYGADDLDRYGDWVNISGYGNVWRPSSRATSSYLNWSPYRYGQWRWLPYYGWTWVNDEPWGWATYHHGRWIHHRGRWYWSPHRSYSRGRSWWRPALVFVTYVGNNFCWYPLPYGYGYYDYNRRYRNRWPRRRRNNRNRNNRRRNGDRNRNTTPQTNIARGNRMTTPPLGRVPTRGVVTVPAGQFDSKQRKGFGVPPLNVARKVLGKKPVVANSPPIIPDRTFNPGKKVAGSKTRGFDTKIGASKRISPTPMDKELRRKIYRNRTPATQKTVIPDSSTTRTRKTGVFDRKRSNTNRTSGNDPVNTPSIIPTTPTRRSTKKAENPPPVSAPTRRTTTRRTTNRVERKRTPPASTSTRRTTNRNTNKSQRKQSPPTRRSSPPARRSSPPARRSSPPAKRSNPTRSAPKRSAPKRSAPSRKPSKPSKPSTSKSKKT